MQQTRSNQKNIYQTMHDVRIQTEKNGKQTVFSLRINFFPVSPCRSLLPALQFFFPFSCSRCSSVIFIATASPMSFAKSSLQSQLHIFIKTSSSLAPVAVVFMLSKHLFCFVDFVSYALRFSYTKRTHCKSRGT